MKKILALLAFLVPSLLFAQTAEYHGTTVFVWEEMAAADVPTPAAGSRALYVDSTSHKLSVKKSDGTTQSLEEAGGGGSTPTGTGFWHITAGVSDAASKLVDTTDITNLAVNNSKIANSTILYAKIQDVSATSRFLGRITAGAGSIEELTAAQAATLLPLFNGAAKGLAPASTGTATDYLAADGTWTVPAGVTPVGASYITQTPNAILTNEQALNSLADGILMNTAGVLSKAIAANFPTLNQNTTGTAAALTADPANCAAGSTAGGVTAAGVAESCIVMPVNTTATASQWFTAYTAATGAFTKAQPAFTDISGSVTDAQVPNTITIDLATTATTANAGDSATAFFTSGTIEVARGGTGAAPGADDQLLVSDSTSAATWRAVADCDASGARLNYDTTTNAFSCVTSLPTIANANTADVTASGADTYITGSSLAIGSRQQAGTTLTWRYVFTKTAAGVATPIFQVRFGTAGSTADTSRVTFTGVAQTGAIDTGWVDISCIVRNIGASGVVACGFRMAHKLATTGVANVAQDQLFQVSSAAFNNNVSNLIAGVSVNPGASGVWTIQVVSSQADNLN